MSGEISAKIWKGITLRNAGTNQCMYANPDADNWMSIQTRGCNPQEDRQKFTMFEAQDTIRAFDNTCVTVTHENDTNVIWKPLADVRMIGCNDGGNSVNDRKPSVVKLHPYKDAPFLLSAVSAEDRAFTDDGGVVKYVSRAGANPKQLWVPNRMATKCDSLKIPISECSLNRMCQGDPSDPLCLELCGDPAIKSTLCDTWAVDYCKAHPDDNNFCGCLNPGKNPAPGAIDQAKWDYFAGKPHCYLKQCVANGSAYMLEKQKTDSCPPQTWCIAHIGGDQATVNAVNTSIVQNCGNDSNVSSSHGPLPPTTSPTTIAPSVWNILPGTGASSSPISPVQIGLIAGTAIVGLLLLIVIISILRRRRRRDF